MCSALSVSNSTPDPKPEAPSFDAKTFLAGLTEAPGVYRMLDGQGRVLYVGKAKNLKKRVSSYFQKTGHSPRIGLMLQQVAQVEITATRSEAEALILENTLIKKLAPKYNILFRDDKSYPYIRLSGDEFPQLAYHRGGFERHSRYFGPFPNGLAVREAIQLLQKTFLLRTCENAVFAHRSRPCLMHQIKRCKAPCVGLVSAEEYGRDVHMAEMFLRGRHGEVIQGLTERMQVAADQLQFETAAALRDQVRALQAVLHRQYVSSTREEDVDILAVASLRGELCINLAMVRGGLHLGDRAFFPRDAVGDADPAEALVAFISQHYLEHPPPPRLVVGLDVAEECATVFEGKKVAVLLPRNEMERAWLLMAEKNAELAATARGQASSRAGERMEALRAALELAEPPQRIECFDISHTMGEGTVASCVVCVDGTMKNGEYRRFNITGITPGDDYAAMRQALERRYGKVAAGEGVAPDLILIDGGKGQHRMAREVLEELGLDHLRSIGIAKGEERRPGLETLFVSGRPEPLQLAPDHAGFHLIQEIRDEAHRFAITGHRARRAKARGHSALEEMAGIGPARRRKLLAHFGGLDGVRSATVEDICRVEGISRKLAEEIYRQLH
ncbi:excinuclease ABC subunit UvrC [Denitratisoma oestradiolicum]|uniref:UvrABC system protein C n=1 Tax=Denitratisoma oestradiolicum TaxID=311182 RepID=A0A6S6XX63_9PROT|nr:excinuclease ABC subunit UvrC [Denitratisoma oestradiolicum]TWO81973.1 excinuclease ABC subunit C [Denitratisoma oestradiolicum]CAB1368883.1 excinuclease UvrABC, endonuclease subunit [Denitratisoma oestradiolicum]